MIDGVYHLLMSSKTQRGAVLVETSDRQNRRWSVERNEALRELLDHLAEELALEYVRLMKAAKLGNGEPN
jgi:hypothetical protein